MIIQSTRVYIASTFTKAQVEIEGEKIVGIYPYNTKPVDVDYGTRRILPGFYDVHTHGFHGYDTTAGRKEAKKELEEEKEMRVQLLAKADEEKIALKQQIEEEKETRIQLLAKAEEEKKMLRQLIKKAREETEEARKSVEEANRTVAT